MTVPILRRWYGPLVFALSTVLLFATVRGGARPQQPPQQQQPPPQFRSTTDLVLLDVSVLDKSRRPIKGLTAADFTVLEDGVAQQIATFQAVVLPDAEVLPAKWMGRAAFDVQTNRMPDGRLVLIYLDERQANASPFATKSTLDTAHAIIDHLSPSDVAAVGFVLDHKGAQEFTTDRARLHAAVDTFAASPYIGISIVGTLRDLSQLLGAIPERRKVIIYIGPGQSFSIEVLSAMEKTTTQGTTPSFGSDQVSQLNQYNALLSLFRIANRANVSIYTIDPNGLDDSSPSTGPKEFLRIVANSTGARAVVGNNVPASQVPVILGENASYYLMAFRSSNATNDGKFRRIEVKVNRPGADVRSRRGYVEGRPGPVNAAGVNPALGRLIPATQLALALWAEPAISDPSGSHAVALMIDVELPVQGAPRSEHLAVAYSIVDMSGKERASGRQDLTVSPPPGLSAGSYFAGIKAVANLPPGKYDIRVSAQSVERNRRGGLLGDVVVPDFAKDPLSASGVFIGEAATGVAAPGDPLSRLLAVTPTTDRLFTAASPIVAAMRIYQAKQPPAPVSVKVTILDAKDKPAFEATERLEAAPFAAAGFADYRFMLPLATLGPGQFLLRIEALRSGAPAVRREVRFSTR